MAALSTRALRERTSPEVYGAAKAAGVLTVAGLATGISNFTFNVIIARAGGSGAYGGIGTLLSLFTVASFLAIGTQYAVARRAAIHDIDSWTMLGGCAKTMGPWLLCLAPLFVVIGPVAGFLHLPGSAPVAMALGAVMLTIASSLAMGVLLGRRQFRVVAMLNIGSALSRLALGGLLPHLLDTTDAALLATLLPSAGVLAAATSLVGLRLSRSPPIIQRSAAAYTDVTRDLVRDSFAGALGSMALWAVWAAPLVAARHGLGSADSGRFAAAQVLASALLFLTAPITTAFFPTIARHRDRSAFAIGVGFNLLISLAGTVALTTLGPAAMIHLYGGQFAIPRTVMLEFGLSASVVAMSTFTLWAGRARYGRRSRVTVIAIFALALEALLGSVITPSAQAFAAGPLIALGAVALAALGITVIRTGGFASTIRRYVEASPAPTAG